MVADDDNETAGILLLQDIRRYFETQKTDRVSSSGLAKVLHEMLDRPWPEWGKNAKPISEAQVAKLLRNFKVKSRNLRIDDSVVKGYLLEQLKDAFVLYLPAKSSSTPHTAATPLQSSDFNNLQAIRAATNENDVAAPKPANPLKNNNCSGVAAPNGKNGKIDGSERRCAHCGQLDFPGSRLLECWVDDAQSWGHQDCLEQAWRNWPGMVEVADQ